MKETTYTRKEMLRIFKTPIGQLSEEEHQYIASGQMMRETSDLYFVRRKGKGEADVPRLEGKKESDQKKLGIKIQELLTSDEFNAYKRQWLADLSAKVLTVDFDNMKAIHGEFPAAHQSKRKRA